MFVQRTTVKAQVVPPILDEAMCLDYEDRWKQTVKDRQALQLERDLIEAPLRSALQELYSDYNPRIAELRNMEVGLKNAVRRFRGSPRGLGMIMDGYDPRSRFTKFRAWLRAWL